MKRIHYIGLLVFAFAFIEGCSSNSTKSYTNEDGNKVVELNYRFGGLKSRTIYLDDNSEYIYTEFYDDQVLKDSLHVIDGKTEGKRIFYDQSGDLMHTEHYLGGILHGVHRAEYSNGVTSFDGFRLNGNMVGEWEFHYPDGHPITYEFYDSTGHIQYLEKFGANGEVLSIEGKGFIFSSLSLKQAEVSDTIIAEVLTVMPPASKVFLEIQIRSLNKEKQTVFANDVNQVLTKVPFSINERGDYTLEFILKVTDIQSGKSRVYNRSQNLNLK